MAVPPNWFETFFHGVTLDLWRKAIPPEQTSSEANFLIDHLNCAPGAHVLDVPCGNGRLSFALAGRGLRVTGVDISPEFIAEAHSIAARTSNSAGSAGDTKFTLVDMRQLEATSTYNGAYCF